MQPESKHEGNPESKCEGKTKNGNPCGKRAQPQRKFCALHDPVDWEGNPRHKCKGILSNGFSTCSHWAAENGYCSLHSPQTDETHRSAKPSKAGPNFAKVTCSGKTLKGVRCKMQAKLDSREQYYCSKHLDQRGNESTHPPPPRPQPSRSSEWEEFGGGGFNGYSSSFDDFAEQIHSYLRSRKVPPPPPPPPPPQPQPRVDPVLSAKSYFGITSVNYDALKKEYRARALKLHPDKPGGDAELFKILSNHFSVLEQYVKNGFH